MNIYTPATYRFIRYDLDHVLGEIGELYDVHIHSSGVECFPLTQLPNGVSWASDSSHEHFNRIIPRIKLLHMGMYAILEAVAKNEFKENSMKAAFEAMDPLFKPFRELNNQFKHFEPRTTDIQLIMSTTLIGKHNARLEPLYRFDGRNVPYSRFVVMFIELLKKVGVVNY